MCFFSGLVAIARAKHPIPSRSRKLSAAAAMVLRLKTWESSSPPNLTRNTKPLKTTHKKTNAGWSSQVARQAHNLKVTGSNPVPATKNSKYISKLEPDAFRRDFGVTVLVNTWSTFPESPLARRTNTPSCLRQICRVTRCQPLADDVYLSCPKPCLRSVIDLTLHRSIIWPCGFCGPA